MSLTIITGSSSIEKQRFVAEYASHGLSRECGIDGVTYLFPQVSIAKEFAHTYIANSESQGESYSFNRWFEKIWEQHGASEALVTSEQRDQALQEVALTCATGAKGYVIESKRYYTLPGVQRIFREIVETFGTQLLEVQYKDFVLSQLGPGIYDFVEKYFAYLNKHHRIEIADAMRLISRRKVSTNTILVFSGFNNFSQHQLDLLIGLSRENEIVLSLNYDEKSLFARPLSKLISYIQNNTESHIVDFGKEDREGVPKDQVSEWASNFSETSVDVHKTAIANGVLSISLAAGKNAEIAAIGNEVIKVLDSYRPEEIVVAMRNAQEYAPGLQKYLSSRGVALDYDLVVPLRQTYFGASIIEMFRTNEILWSMMNREAKFEFQPTIKTHAFFQTALVNTDIESFWKRDAKLRKTIMGGNESLLAANRNLKSENAQAASIFSSLQEAVKSRKPQTWKSLFDLCLSETLKRPDLTQADINTTSLAHHELLAIVSSCVAENDKGEERVDLLSLAQSILFANLQFTRPQARKSVLLTDVHRMRGFFTPVLILGGLANNNFKSTDRGSLVKDLDERLSSGTLNYPGALSAADRDSLLINDLLASAQNRVSLIAQVASEDNTQKALVPFLKMITTVLDPLGQERNSMGSQEDLRAHLSELQKEGVTIIDALNPDAIMASLTAGGKTALYSSEELETPQFELARGEENLDLYGGDLFEKHEFSPSALEAYAHCPYRWFLNRYVPNRPVDKQFSPTEMGSLVHKLLEVFYKTWNENHELERIGEKNLNEAKRIFESVAPEVLASELKEANASDDVKIKEFKNKAIENAWNRIENDKRFLLSDDDVYYPADFEVKIGTGVVGDDNKEEGLDAHVGKMKISGSIDRVDRNSEGNHFILDYKGSLGAYAHGDKWIEKCSLQAGLYWLAYENATGNTVAGSAYISYKDNKRKWLFDNGLIDESLIKTSKEQSHECDARQVLDNIAAIAEQSAELMHAGNVKIAQSISINGFELNENEKGCKYCAYKACPVLARKPESEE